MPARRGGVDVYLFPAVVGGGLGDIEEVLAAGRRLARSGYPVRLYRRPGRPLPRSVDGPWEWPRLERVDRLVPTSSSALTVAPAFGVSAAPARPGPFGRAGPWAVEARDVESAYGADRTVHASLEEFARTLTSVEETRERFREGGVRSREIPTRVAAARHRREVEAFRSAFERFRGFDRPNVLPLFATFAPRAGFAREFPHAVQTGPLWPGTFRPPSWRRPRATRHEWVWYASPSSAESIAPELVRALAALDPPVRLFVRSPRPWPTVRPSDAWTLETRPLAPSAWRRRFAAAEMRVVTGSRTLLEAIELGGPFLYFNGVTGSGARRRRHRPEKLIALLASGRRSGAPTDLLRDLADFASGRRISEVVRRAARREGGWRRFGLGRPGDGFRPPYHDAGALLVAVARALGPPNTSAGEVVIRARAGAMA